MAMSSQVLQPGHLQPRTDLRGKLDGMAQPISLAICSPVGQILVVVGNALVKGLYKGN